MERKGKIIGIEDQVSALLLMVADCRNEKEQIMFRNDLLKNLLRRKYYPVTRDPRTGEIVQFCPKSLKERLPWIDDAVASDTEVKKLLDDWVNAYKAE